MATFPAWTCRSCGAMPIWAWRSRRPRRRAGLGRHRAGAGRRRRRRRGADRCATPRWVRSCSRWRCAPSPGASAGSVLASGFEVQTQGLQFETREGQLWPGGNVFLQWIDADGRQPAQGELRADKLDLFALGQVASRLPLGAATHAALAAYAPQGLVETVQATWRGPLAALQQYQAKGRVVGLEVAARPPATAPGQPVHAARRAFARADVDFDLSQTGGKARLRVRDGAVDVPGVFEDPVIRIDALTADLQWKVDGEAVAVTVNNLKFSNADAQGEGQASWHTGATTASRFPGVLDLQGQHRPRRRQQGVPLSPVGVPKTARDYVQGLGGPRRGVRRPAFASGATCATFPSRTRGAANFASPPTCTTSPTRSCRAASTAADRSWPALTQLSRGTGVRARRHAGQGQAAGRFVGAPRCRSRSRRRSRTFATPSWRSRARSGARWARPGDRQQLPRLGQTVDRRWPRRAAAAMPTCDLKLVLPIARHRSLAGAGQRHLAGNDMQITPDTPVLARSRGIVQFIGKGVRSWRARRPGRWAGTCGWKAVAAAHAMNMPDGRSDRRIARAGHGHGRWPAPGAGDRFVSRLARDASGAAGYASVSSFAAACPRSR